MVFVLSCSSAPELQPGETVHGELAVGDTARYALEIANRRTVRLTVVPETAFGPPPALRVQVFDPRGWTLAEGRVRDPRTGLFAWVTNVDGRHLVRISMADRLERGGYRIVYDAVPAEPDDTWRVAAENREAEAVRAHEQLDLTAVFGLLEESRAAWHRAGETWREVSTLLDLCDQKSDYDEYRDDALGNCAEALRLARRADLQDLVPEALTFRGLALKRARRYAEAAEAYREARTVAEAREDWGAAAKAVYNNGTLYLARGDLERASTELDEALALARRGGALETLSYAQLAKANVAKRMADPDAAVAWASAARADAVEAGDLFAEAAALQELGNLAQRRGDLSAALGFFEASRDSNEILGNWNKVVDNERSLAVLTLALRGADVALTHLQRALKLTRMLADREREADVLREMGTAYQSLGDLGEAENHLRASLAAAPDAAAAVRAGTLHRLGNVALARDDVEAAIDLLLEALELRRHAHDLRGLSLNHRDLGIALTRAGRFREARDHLESALDLDRVQHDSMRQAWSLYRLAELEDADGDLDSARTRIEEALELGRGIRASLATDRLRTDFFSGVRPLFDLYVNLLLRLAAERPDGNHEAAAFHAMEDSRARGLLDLLLQSPEKMRGAIDPELQHQVEEIEQRLAYLSDQLVEARARSDGEARVREIESHYEAAEGEWDRVDRRFRELSQAYRSLREPKTLDLAAAQRLLRPDQAILSFWMGRGQSHVFAVTAEGYSIHSLPPSDEIRQRAARFREALVRRVTPSRFTDDALWLHRELVTPAMGTIGERQELIVVPDGVLQLVPFGALLTGPPQEGAGGLPYLLRERSISYAPSVTVLAALASDARRRHAEASAGLSSAPRLAVFADPMYAHAPGFVCPDWRAGGDLTPPTATALEASRTEGEGAVALHGERVSRAFFGPDATEEQVVRGDVTRHAERLHFAVHGVVCESQPERSALILALDDDAAEDGLLQVREIFGLSLQADLVVLSGCETGLGKEVTGEGIVGLSRSFLHAGAASVMVTLWQIADRAGTELILDFYRGLEDGRSHGDKAEALRLAQLEMVDGGGSHSHPFFWAPFVVIGARDVPSRQ